MAVPRLITRTWKWTRAVTRKREEEEEEEEQEDDAEKKYSKVPLVLPRRSFKGVSNLRTIKDGAVPVDR
jgi:hypothetical protein